MLIFAWFGEMDEEFVLRDFRWLLPTSIGLIIVTLSTVAYLPLKSTVAARAEVPSTVALCYEDFLDLKVDDLYYIARSVVLVFCLKKMLPNK